MWVDPNADTKDGQGGARGVRGREGRAGGAASAKALRQKEAEIRTQTRGQDGSVSAGWRVHPRATGHRRSPVTPKSWKSRRDCGVLRRGPRGTGARLQEGPWIPDKDRAGADAVATQVRGTRSTEDRELAFLEPNDIKGGTAGCSAASPAPTRSTPGASPVMTTTDVPRRGGRTTPGDSPIYGCAAHGRRALDAPGGSELIISLCYRRESRGPERGSHPARATEQVTSRSGTRAHAPFSTALPGSGDPRAPQNHDLCQLRRPRGPP
ncbi:uncharacterized protein LOC122236525 [Panthera tigris]|uniref:uncharacterized protein LOC122236525 n=1 Tax=Panthera tigris TaxID=9694 RepID=UPI001C6FB153|nr:uncharacterized protein LOC122236525 [Panthera tigris]